MAAVMEVRAELADSQDNQEDLVAVAEVIKYLLLQEVQELLDKEIQVEAAEAFQELEVEAEVLEAQEPLAVTVQEQQIQLQVQVFIIVVEGLQMAVLIILQVRQGLHTHHRGILKNLIQIILVEEVTEDILINTQELLVEFI